MSIRLVNIYDYDEEMRHRLLWQLLEERPMEANISHRGMPAWEQHVAFVESRPYMMWYFIAAADDLDRVFGAVYLGFAKSGTRTFNEVGIGVFKLYQGKGIGRDAMIELQRIHKGPLYANIAPGNETSKAFFESLGFRKIQEVWKV